MACDGAQVLNGIGTVIRGHSFDLARVHVTAIHRIHNPLVEARFKAWCTAHNGHVANAPQRFHGTDPKAAASIANEGFDLIKGNGGVWVATHALYSVTYSLFRNRNVDWWTRPAPYPKGLTMLLVRVWTGKSVDETCMVTNVDQTWPTHLIHFDLVPV